MESAASGHIPEIALVSYTSEPGPTESGYSLVGQVDVECDSHLVELWTLDSDVGEARQVTLPPSSSGRYRLRAARAFAPEVRGNLSVYLSELDNIVTHGLERWRFEFWPD